MNTIDRDYCRHCFGCATAALHSQQKFRQRYVCLCGVTFEGRNGELIERRQSGGAWLVGPVFGDPVQPKQIQALTSGIPL